MPPPRRSIGRRAAALSVTANPVPTSRGARRRGLPHPFSRYGVLHFVVTTTDRREIIKSVDSHGLVAAANSGCGDGLVIPVGVDKDGNYFTGRRLPGEPFESLDQLVQAGVVWLAAFPHDLPSYEEQHVVGSASSQIPLPELQHLHYVASRDPSYEEQQQVGDKPVPELQHRHAEASSDSLYEEQQHVVGSASSQMPVSELQHLQYVASRDRTCEELLGQTASPEMLQEQYLSSLMDFLNATTLDRLSIIANSSSSVQSDAIARDTIEVHPPAWHCLSSPPILVLNRYKWGYTFYIRIDLKGHYHTYPRVVEPFESLQQTYSAIDCYLEEHRDTSMFMDQPRVSRVDKVVRQCLYWPDGTRKMKQPIDEKRDSTRQLVHALVDKYNEYIHRFGDVAYEVKDVVRFQTVQGASDHSRMHHHINFTIKTKGADDSTCVIDDLFFAEVTFRPGDEELVVSCFCTVKPTDNGCCHGCVVKHPNDAAAYTAGPVSPLGEYKLGDMMWTGCNESLKEEEARVRSLFDPQGLVVYSLGR